MKPYVVVAALAASLVVGLPDRAAAQSLRNLTQGTVPAPPTTIDIQVCNRSGRNGTVAIIYMEVGASTFVTRGWYQVNNGACTQVGSTTNGTFYLYGDTLDGSGRVWSGDHGACVQYPGPFTWYDNGGGECPAGYEHRAFSAVRAESFGIYTWNLDP